MHIPYLTLQNSLINSKELDTSRNWMCDGGTTTYAFEMATNGRLPSKPVLKYISARYKYVQTPQNSYESLTFPTSFSTCDQVQKYTFYGKGKFPLYFKSIFIYIWNINLIATQSNLDQFGQFFSILVAELILNFLPIQNILFCRGTSPINLTSWSSNPQNHWNHYISVISDLFLTVQTLS